ncbi:MAG: hypothetical protein ACKVZ6_13465 [Kineosporiaceae bacterium]
MRSATALVVVTAVVWAAVRLAGWPDAWLPGFLIAAGCTVTTADGERSIDAADARRVTSALLADATDPRPAGAPHLDAGSGDGSADPVDPAVVEALRTRDGALTCRLPRDRRAARDGLTGQDEGAGGLTPRADGVRRAMLAAGGDLPLGGFEPGGVTTGHMPGSAHYEGRAIDAFFRPVGIATARHGWLLAHWLVAHAGDLDVQTVIFDDRIWSASLASSGWRPYVPPGSPTTDAVRRHLDHVHVDVVAGR